MLQTDDFRLRAQAAFNRWGQDAPQYVAVDTETTGLGFYDEPFCVTLAWLTPAGVQGHYVELGDPETDDNLRLVLAATPELVFHNAKFDLQKLQLKGLVPLDYPADRFHDTEAIAHLLDEHRRMALKVLAQEVLGEQPDDEAALKAWFKEKKIKKADWRYDELPRELLIPYAIKDTDFTIRLFDRLYPQLEKHSELLGLYDMERELTVALLEMERNGLGLDLAYLERTAREYNGQALRKEIEIRQLTGKDDFNPNSPKQVMEALEERGVRLESTDKETLAGVEDPLAAAILELRTLRKIHGTYLVALIQEQKGGIVHPWFRQHGTKTGRMSSGGATA